MPAPSSALYQRVEHSLLVSRQAKLAFPSVFMGITGRPSGDTDGDGGAVLTFKDDATFRDSTGELNWCALCGLLDGVLGAASDMQTGSRVRPATAHIELQMTGASSVGDISVEARFVAHAHTGRVKQSLISANIKCGDALVGRASATCVLLDLAQDETRAQWPWLPDGFKLDEQAPVTFSANEMEALKACERAETLASEAHHFIDHLWCGIPQAQDGKAHLRINVAPHLGNRIGHVQGGLLLGAAAMVANAAASEKMRLSNISAYFVSPGVGATLDVQSSVTRQGRNLSLVQTQITGPTGKLVVETMSQHVAT